MTACAAIPDAIEATWPQALVQTCVIHLLRASMRLCSWKDRKTIVAGLRRVYTAVNAEAAGKALDELEEQWGNRYPDAPMVVKSSFGGV